MGKEKELLKAIKEKHETKIQKLLTVTEKRKGRESLNWTSVDSGDKVRVELRHIDVNTVEAGTGYTPLLLAILNGLKTVVEILVLNSANVNARDIKGNTVLHLAAFMGRKDILDHLLANDAEVNAQNEDGNTALHIACEAVIEQRALIIKSLLRAEANVWSRNKYNFTPLDTAAVYKRDEAIHTLMTYIPTLKDNKTAIVEAAIRGFASTVEALMEFGVVCNTLDDNHGTTALHEAVRYQRCDVVQVLLSFNADQTLENLKKETAQSLASSLHGPNGDTIVNLLKEHQSEGLRRRPTLLSRELSQEESTQQEPRMGHIKDYPELPNNVSWTQNRPLYCSTCTEKNPNTQLLDDNMKSFWVIPVLHDAWTVFDFQREHIITGITIYGWNSPQMMKSFQLQISDTLEGTWTTVTSHTCQLLGSTDPKEPAFPQKLSGFTCQSRYLRLYVIDNHGGSYICFQGIQFHGVDGKVVEELQGCGLAKSVDLFVMKGFNTWKRLLDISHDLLFDLVLDPEKRAALLEVVYKGRREMYPMTMLSWMTTPVVSAFEGEVLADFSVQSDPGTTEVLQLVVQGAQVKGDTCRRLIPQGEGKPSTAVFTNIVLEPAGLYSILVQGVNTPITLMSPKPVEIRPKVKTSDDISSAFDEIQKMLSEVQADLNDT